MERFTIWGRKVPGDSVAGRMAWGKPGIAISQMRELPAALYSGEIFDKNVAVVSPRGMILHCVTGYKRSCSCRQCHMAFCFVSSSLLQFSRAHYEQQQMRLISPILEKGKVDIVFAGHVHNYQRTYPLTFKPDNLGNQLVAGANNIKIGKTVNGRWTLDKKFDGKRNTKPNGVIYIVTGAGGQGLYNPEQTKDTDSWQKFTFKFESRVHSFTIMDVDGKTLTLNQVDINGKEVDRMKIIK